ncbi:uncharacterized protein [Amphiura filiformis]|uniref:uncharacterized protein n=1 Tax=Amphiura filiformis TaxID=82378 RepID=UPI003B21FFF7
MRGLVIAYVVLFSAVTVNSDYYGPAWTCKDMTEYAADLYDYDCTNSEQCGVDNNFKATCQQTCDNCECTDKDPEICIDEYSSFCERMEDFRQICPVMCRRCPRERTLSMDMETSAEALLLKWLKRELDSNM